MRWTDDRHGYGWISIALHWLAAALIVALLFVGDSIRTVAGVDVAMLRLHTTLGLSGYVLLWLRVIWRFRSGHPDRLPTQKPFSYGLGKAFHHLLAAAVVVMLLSGPLMAWGGGVPLYVGPWRLPGPPLESPALYALGRQAHRAGAASLALGVLIHILAVIKHAAIDRDGSFDRILVPGRPDDPQ